MKKQELPVLKPLHHGGRSYVRGDRVSLTPVDAVALAKRGYVSVTKGVKVERTPEPAPPAVAPEPTGDTSEKAGVLDALTSFAKDMGLVSSETADVTPEPPNTDGPTPPRPRRTYRRRDLTAEPPNS